MSKSSPVPAMQHIPRDVLHQPELFPASDWTQRWWRGHHLWRHKSVFLGLFLTIIPPPAYCLDSVCKNLIRMAYLSKCFAASLASQKVR